MSKYLPPKLIFSQEACARSAGTEDRSLWINDGKIPIWEAQIHYDKWYSTHITPIFENCVPVVGVAMDDNIPLDWRYYKTGVVGDSHEGLVVNIKSIRTDSQDIFVSLARSLSQALKSSTDENLKTIYKAACKYLESRE